MASAKKYPKLVEELKKPIKFNIAEWNINCALRNVHNCCMPVKELVKLLNENIMYLTEKLPEKIIGDRDGEVIADLLKIVEDNCKVLVKDYIDTSLPYREKCRIILYLDEITDLIHEHPATPRIRLLMVFMNLYLMGKIYSDSYHRKYNLPLNYMQKIYDRQFFGV